MSKTPSADPIILTYERNIKQHADSILALRKIKRTYAFARLITISAGLVLCFYFNSRPGFIILIIVLIAILFIILVFRVSDKTAVLEDHERMIEINKHELDIMLNRQHVYEDGIQFSDTQHVYASDLDLFGPHSLFQYLNRCHADQSKKLLADYLKSPCTPDQILLRQNAIDELSKKQDWCQRFQSVAMSNPLAQPTEKRLKHWIDHPGGIPDKKFWMLLPYFYPLISISILLSFIMDFISTGFFTLCLVGFFGISSLISSRIQSTYDLLSLIYPQMDALHRQLALIENGKFKSTFLLSLQNRLKKSDLFSAATAMRSFRGILKRFDMRLNLLVFFFLNAFLLWDLRQMNALNNWRKNYRSRLTAWFEVIAETEVVISMASLRYNEPTWTFPSVDNNFYHFSGDEIGHPLIEANKRVANSFELQGIGLVVVITGSNMAGKSTFLRALGTNIVLALAGAPVCAKKMDLSAVKLLSSMRVSDNLAENTSTFYAELKKLKLIIDSVNSHEPVFILLDEVLRGTNSMDRHKGTKALVRQLLNQQAVAIIATHDTELAKLESEENAAVHNYHFDAEIHQDELFFDYKIKNGISESFNATTLMKKIGIHFQD
jgi:hypothetical protein